MDAMYEVTRLVAWVILGCSLAGMAWAIGWKSLLRAAPFIFFGWLGLAVWATAWPPFPEWRGWLKFGVPFNVLEFAPVAIGLLGAWIASKTGMRVMRVLWAIVVILLAAETAIIACHEERAERVRRFFAESQIRREAMKQREPNGDPLGDGRLFYNTMCIGVCLLGSGLLLLVRQVDDEPTKVFVTVIGLSIGGRAVGSVLGGIGITPMVEIAVPFLSGGGSLAAITILSLGIVCMAFKSTSIGVSQAERSCS